MCRALVLVVLAALASAGQERGFVSVRRKATGFFRVEQVQNRWYFITPDGHPYVALGANHTAKFLSEPRQSAPMVARLGGVDQARAALIASYRASGLTAGEAYAPYDAAINEALPWVANIDFPGPSKFAFDVWDPVFQAALRESVLAQLKPLAANRMVLGIAFADLPVWTARRVAYFAGLPAEAPGRRKYDEFRKRQGTTGVLTAAQSDLFLGEVAEELYARLKALVREGAPRHLFFGERFVLRAVPKPVLQAVGRHVDVFCTQALILSPRRPPEWQVFQRDGYDADQAVAGKPMLVIDWAAPFSLDETYETERGTVYAEREASDQAARWLQHAFELPYLAGVFHCQWIGSHGNDRWFPAGRMKRTFVRDDGSPFAFRTERIRQAHEAVLNRLAAELQR